MLESLSLNSAAGRVLTVMAINARAMTVSHANASYFWVVTQFSKTEVTTAYKAQTIAILIQDVTGMTVDVILSKPCLYSSHARASSRMYRRASSKLQYWA